MAGQVARREDEEGGSCWATPAVGGAAAPPCRMESSASGHGHAPPQILGNGELRSEDRASDGGERRSFCSLAHALAFPFICTWGPRHTPWPRSPCSFLRQQAPIELGLFYVLPFPVSTQGLEIHAWHPDKGELSCHFKRLALSKYHSELCPLISPGPHEEQVNRYIAQK